MTTMADDKLIHFPTHHVALPDAIEIVKQRLSDETLSPQTVVCAIEQVAEMETHNSVSKNDLVNALRWLFEHYEF